MPAQAPPTNLRILEPSRKRVRAGDIFVMKVLDRGYLFGRVVSTEAELVGMKGCILIYIFEGLAPAEEPIPELRRDSLLVPPIMTNRLPWSRGYFKTVDHRPLRHDDVLEQHCFHDYNCGYYDEHNTRLPRRYEPCGVHALKSFRTIDDSVSTALGVPLVPTGDREEVTPGEEEVVLYLPDVKGDDLAVSAIEQQLIEALKGSPYGAWEGHGYDSAQHRWEIRFNGKHPSRLAETLLAALGPLNLPSGTFLRVGGQIPLRIDV